jgi:hypothetical protein
MNIEERVVRLQALINEGRIIRGSWAGVDEQGRETACLLGALAPEAGEAEDACACPASVMPEWFALITPWMDDRGSGTVWPSAIRRYAVCAARWSALDDAAWRRVEIAARRAAVVEAMSYTTDEQVLDAGREVLAWLGAGMSEPSLNMAAKAEDAAEGDAKAADAAAMLAAAWAAKAADVSTAALRAAKWAAFAALRAAADAKETTVVAAAAQRATADRIIDAVLSALEKECGL